ncbi:MAG TPA: hypothetical protein VM120_29650 [Bryobacteraceae bacterium]|nr:hypothetical protein [Bryobacteraceae bacterium]
MLLVVLALFSLAVPALGADPAVDESYRSSCIKRTFGKMSYVRVAAGTSFQHLRNAPREWGRGAAGFGRRMGTGFGRHMIRTGIQYGVSAALHEQIGYIPSGKERFRPRLQYALLSTVVTRKKITDRQTVAVGRISSAFGAGLISRLWMPARFHTVANGVSSAGVSLGLDAGVNVFREFWPDMRKKVRRGNQSVKAPKP